MSCLICHEYCNDKFFLTCAHFYHKECIFQWFDKLRNQGKKETCPLCWTEIIFGEPKTELDDTSEQNVILKPELKKKVWKKFVDFFKKN